MRKLYRAGAVLIAGCLAVPVANAADPGLEVGAQFGVTRQSSEFTGPGSEAWHLQQGTGASYGVAGAYKTSIRGQAIRWTLQADHSVWDNADSTTALAGLDAFWGQPDDSGGVYIGPRVGALYFADDLTGDSSIELAYGYEAGFLQSLAPLDSQLAGMSLGLYVRQVFTDLRNDGQVPGSTIERDIELDGQTTFGLQLIWSL